MPPRSPEVPFTFNYVEDIPIGTLAAHQKPPTMISVVADSYSTSASAQRSFDKGNPALLALSTSGQINEYQVVSVDENRQVLFKHKLPYIQRADKLKVENKSQSTTIKDLTKRLGDMEKKMGDMEKKMGDMEKKTEDMEKKMGDWQVAAKAVEAYAILLWQEPLAIPRSTKTFLKKLHINDVLQLRLQSQLHCNKDERDDKTQSASVTYTKIPIHYRNVLDELIRKKAQCAVDRTAIAHPTICKSQIVTFLASHFTQQNVATDLLRKVPSLQVLGMDGTYVSMFQEG